MSRVAYDGAVITSVAGGAGGVEAEYGDLKRLGVLFEAMGREVGWAAMDDSTLAADRDLVASALLCPGTAAEAGAAIGAATVGPHGLMPQALVLEVKGFACQFALSIYRAADEARRAVLEAAGWTAGFFTAFSGGALLALGLGAAYGAQTGSIEPIGPLTKGLLAGTRLSPLGALARWAALAPDTTAVGGGSGDLADALYGGRRHGIATASERPVEHEAPSTLSDLTHGVEVASGDSGRFTVQELSSADGRKRFIVQLPGTDFGDWASARDFTTNIQLLEGGRTPYGDAVEQALARSGARAEDPVMLVGHSQGGMQAMALADDPDFPYRVEAVMTVGSPVSGTRPPDDVPTLNLEHERDIVPQMDSGRNGAGPHQVTVRGVVDTGGGMHNHDLKGSYGPLSTAADNSDDPSVRAVVDGFRARGFLDGDAHSRTSTFQVELDD